MRLIQVYSVVIMSRNQGILEHKLEYDYCFAFVSLVSGWQVFLLGWKVVNVLFAIAMMLN